MEVRWGALALPDLWSNAASPADREAARQLIESAGARAAPLVQAELADVRTRFLKDSLPDLEDELRGPSKKISEAEGQRRLELLVPISAAPPPVDGRLASVMPCWLQRWILWPVAAMRWSSAQTDAVADSSCTGNQSAAFCATATPTARAAERARIVNTLPPIRSKALTSVIGAPNPLLVLGGQYLVKTAGKLTRELQLPPSQQDQLRSDINTRCLAS